MRETVFLNTADNRIPEQYSITVIILCCKIRFSGRSVNGKDTAV